MICLVPGPGEFMRRRHFMGVFAAGVSVALLHGSASAQDFKPSINLNADSRPLTSEEKEKRKAVDDAYKSTMQKLPDKNKSSDPWGNLRSPATTSSK